MASAKQGVVVLPSKKGVNSIPAGDNLLILVKKTGYYNFSIDGKQYFYDERVDTSRITNSLLVFAFNGGSKGEQDKKKKGKITVTKK